MKISLACAALLAAVSCAPHYITGSGKVLPERERRNIISTAERYLGVPYRSGGASPEGFDCSGFVMFVFHRHGLDIPRTTQGQFNGGRRVSLRYARPGDLVFFHTSSARMVTHVGIYAGNGSFIHAPSSGKEVSFASIRNSYWERRFIGAVSYFGRGTVMYVQ
jgi:cell wall-associated NlpC family hydrolase